MLAYLDLDWLPTDSQRETYRATCRDWVFYSYRHCEQCRVLAYIAAGSQPVEICDALTPERAFALLQARLRDRLGVELHSGSSSSSSLATSGAPSSNV